MAGSGEIVALAVPAALAGAAAMGLANATQAKATKEVPEYGVASPRLLWHLLRNRTWLLGTAATVTGLVLQLVALGFAPLGLVQPLLVTALLFTTVFVAWLRRGRVERPILGGALLCAVGLAGFLLLAGPDPGRGAPVAGLSPLPVAVVVLVLLGACLAVAAQRAAMARVLALAIGTGVLYGVTAVLMKLVAVQFRSGLLVAFGHWAIYAACLSGVAGFLLSQHAFQQDTHVAPAVAVITTVDPLVAVALGAAWYGERISLDPASMLGELLAVCAVVGGIAVLTHHGERLARSEAAPAGCMVPSCGAAVAPSREYFRAP